MIPFPGQSVGVIDAYGDDGRGWDLYEDVRFRGRGTDRTLVAGANWYCFAYHRSSAESLLEAGDATPLAVSWVVEVLSGSGTLTLADLDDTGYSEPTTPGAYPNALGSVTVTGAGTYVVPTGTFTADAIRTAGIFGGALAVHIACTSGSVLVAQVKLRAWPATGPLGGWSDAPYTGEPGLTPTPTMRSNAPGVDLNYPTQADLRAAIAASTLPGAAYPASGGVLAFGSMFAIDPGDGSTPYAGGAPGFGYLYRPTNFGLVGPGTLGVDYAYPPGEVAGDANSVLFQPTGSDSVVWTQSAVRASIDSQANDAFGDPVYAGTLSVYLSEIATPDPAGTSTPTAVSGATGYTITPTGSAPIEQEFSLPEFAPDKWLKVVIDHTGFYTSIPDNAGAALNVFYNNLAGTPLRYQWTPAPYYWWDPNGTPPVTTIYPLRLMQRGDGLGMGSGRLFGVGTRQNSTRVFGSI